jgi:hypothetical protein
MAEPTTHGPTGSEWQAANDAYLAVQLARVRLLLHRRILWLRSRWGQDAPAAQRAAISDAQADRLLAGEDRETEARFYADDPTAATLGAAIATAERDAAERARAPGTAPPALETLAPLFGLSAFERDVVLLCLAAERDPTVEWLLAYVQDDATRRHVTPHLALALLAGDDPAAARASLGAAGILRRLRLVTLEPAAVSGPIAATRALALDERMVAYLGGVNRPDERVAEVMKPVTMPLLAPAQPALVERMVDWVGATSRRTGRWPVVNLVAGEDAGALELARAVVDHFARRLHTLDLTRLPALATPESPGLLRVLERDAALLRAAVYVEPPRSESQVSDTAGDLLDRLGMLAFLRTAEPWRSDREALTIRLARPDAGVRIALWQQALGAEAAGIAPALGTIAHQFDLGPRGIARAAAAARRAAELRAPGSPRVERDDVWSASRLQASAQLGDLAQRIVPAYTWDDIVLPAPITATLREIAGQVAHRARVYDDWKFGVKLTRGRGISALFAGPSGTGKTMAAEVLASHLNLDLHRIDLASTISKYIGETEKHLRLIFDRAGGSILFFDEADALFSRRTEVRDSHDRYANIEVDYLLQRMEDHEGLAILATNRKTSLDRAFLRRLRFVVDFPFPDVATRRRIWRGIFPPQARLEAMDWETLARLDVAGGNIRTIALNAAFLAAAEGAPIRMAHVMRAARQEYGKIDKVAAPAEFGRYLELTG